MTAYRKKYYSDEAWARLMQRPEEERTQLWAAWIALFKEVAAVLDEDPAGDKAQELCAKWAELAERTSGGDPEVKVGKIKEWRDHENWPESAKQSISSYRLEEVIDFIKKAYVCRAKKQAVAQWLRTHQPASTNP
jgi:predicted P-loop ATPase